MNSEHIVGRLLVAIESRDLRRIHDSLHPDASWHNVPHEPAVGREAVVELLAPILTWSDHVRWQVVSSAFGRGHGWVERVDRFLIDGEEHAVRCCGVFSVDPDRGVVSMVHDYVDLGEWRSRIAPVYERLAGRSALDVVRRHLDAVERRDIVAMAADYTLDARLVRNSFVHAGWREIRDYFSTVPARLAERELRFDTVEVVGNVVGEVVGNDQVRVAWTIWDDATTTAGGVDTYIVAAGRIVDQRVVLNTPDF